MKRPPRLRSSRELTKTTPLMKTLQESLLDDAKKSLVVNDCLSLIDEEVADKRGLSGIAIKAGYKAVKGIRPSFLREAVDGLLPHFAEALGPIHQEATDQETPVATHFQRNAPRVADALLGITDERAARSDRGLVKTTYEKLRPMAKKNVEAAVPRLGRLVETHTAD